MRRRRQPRASEPPSNARTSPRAETRGPVADTPLHVEAKERIFQNRRRSHSLSDVHHGADVLVPHPGQQRHHRVPRRAGHRHHGEGAPQAAPRHPVQGVRGPRRPPLRGDARGDVHAESRSCGELPRVPRALRGGHRRAEVPPAPLRAHEDRRGPRLFHARHDQARVRAHPTQHQRHHQLCQVSRDAPREARGHHGRSRQARSRVRRRGQAQRGAQGTDRATQGAARG